MNDLIDRQKAIETAMTMYERCTTEDIADLRDLICESLAVLPTADTDISEYSDRLWKTAYERGKTEGIVRCKDCKHRDHETNFCHGRGWPMNLVTDDDFCSKAERRPDEA